jgi:cytochrome c
MKLVCAVLLLVACRNEHGDAAYAVATGGDADRGEERIRAYGCKACHEIPGVRGPDGYVGPSLDKLARRTFLGGEVPNTPDNLVRWLRDPHAIELRTAMPAVGMSEEEARDVAAYLYTLD